MNSAHTNGNGPAFPTHSVWQDCGPDGNSGPVFTETVNRGMSIRQYAAIKLRAPNSGDDWLDDMIRESLRDEFAAKAMQGIVGSIDSEECYARIRGLAARELMNVSQWIAREAYKQAGAMLAARSGAA